MYAGLLDPAPCMSIVTSIHCATQLVPCPPHCSPEQLPPPCFLGYPQPQAQGQLSSQLPILQMQAVSKTCQVFLETASSSASPPSCLHIPLLMA